MNFLSHGFRHLADPWMCAGTALPDWMRMVSRRARAPEELAAAWRGGDAHGAALAAGVLRHHRDDRAFHQLPAFDEAQREAAAALRDGVGAVGAMSAAGAVGAVGAAGAAGPVWRGRFLAHVLVETCLDSWLAARDPALPGAYYATLSTIDAVLLGRAAAPLSSGAGADVAAGLARVFRSFVQSRFIEDYRDDRLLAGRIGQVAARVGVPAPPDAVVAALPAIRRAVAARAERLLAPAIAA